MIPLKTRSEAVETKRRRANLRALLGISNLFQRLRLAGCPNTARLLFFTFAGQSLGSQAFAVGVKRLLRRFMVAHRLLRFGFTGSVAGFPLLGGENAG